MSVSNTSLCVLVIARGEVDHAPKIMLLENKEIGKALWFPYWIATSKTSGKMKWGQRPQF